MYFSHVINRVHNYKLNTHAHIVDLIVEHAQWDKNEMVISNIIIIIQDLVLSDRETGSYATH